MPCYTCVTSLPRKDKARQKLKVEVWNLLFLIILCLDKHLATVNLFGSNNIMLIFTRPNKPRYFSDGSGGGMGGGGNPVTTTQ